MTSRDITCHKNRSQRRPGQPWDPPNPLRSKPRTVYSTYSLFLDDLQKYPKSYKITPLLVNFFEHYLKVFIRKFHECDKISAISWRKLKLTYSVCKLPRSLKVLGGISLSLLNLKSLKRKKNNKWDVRRSERAKSILHYHISKNLTFLSEILLKGSSTGMSYLLNQIQHSECENLFSRSHNAP